MAQLPFPASSGHGSEEWFLTQLDEGAEERKNHLKEWQYNAAAYRNKVKSQTPEGIRVNIEFEKTEQKKPQLFFQQPKLTLDPTARTRSQADGEALKKAVKVFAAVLTRIAGKKVANTPELMNQILFDVLCPSGVGFAKVGYERITNGVVPIPTGRKIPDPNFVAPIGRVLNIAGGGVPMAPNMIDELQTAPNIIFEKYFSDRISPALGLIPADFRGGDYAREADWLGHDFPITEAEARDRKWDIGLSAGSRAPSDMLEMSDNDRIVPREKKGARVGQVWCREMYYYASRVDASEKHPERIRRIVFANRKCVVHEECKDQRFDSRGRHVGGLRSLPIKVMALRYVSDSAHPPSDCTITRQQSDELAEFRTQGIIHRRRAVPLRWVDVMGIHDPKIKELILKGKYYDILPTNGPGDRFVGEVARPAFPQENNLQQDYIMNDVNRAWALGANQSGVTEGGGVTATEIASISQATASRMGKERSIVMDFWLAIVEAFGQLAQLYADRDDYIEIAGADGADAIEVWNRDIIKGEFIYDIVPDSALQPDRAAVRDLALNRYNLLANSKNINQEQLARDTVEAMDGDADRLVIPDPPPPPPEEDKPRITVSLSGQDLDPSSPQYENVVAVLEAQGIKAVPAPPKPAAAPAPGAEGAQGPAEVVDRERLRMAEADERDGRNGGFAGTEGVPA